MKKIMFSDRYGLTEAVLSGRKTMTRRIVPPIEIDWNRRGRVTLPVSGFKHGLLWMDCSEFLPDSGPFDYVAPQKYQPRYDKGDAVAVAQRYQDIPTDVLMALRTDGKTDRWPFENLLRQSHGWANKQGVVASLMPHRIRITNIKAERLQDISDEDCLREGLLAGEQDPKMYGFRLPKGTVISFMTPREAFAALIDRICGRGTWKSNPWMYAYEFELINKED